MLQQQQAGTRCARSETASLVTVWEDADARFLSHRPRSGGYSRQYFAVQGDGTSLQGYAAQARARRQASGGQPPRPPAARRSRDPSPIGEARDVGSTCAPCLFRLEVLNHLPSGPLQTRRSLGEGIVITTRRMSRDGAPTGQGQDSILPPSQAAAGAAYVPPLGHQPPPIRRSSFSIGSQRGSPDSIDFATGSLDLGPSSSSGGDSRAARRAAVSALLTEEEVARWSIPSPEQARRPRARDPAASAAATACNPDSGPRFPSGRPAAPRERSSTQQARRRRRRLLLLATGRPRRGRLPRYRGASPSPPPTPRRQPCTFRASAGTRTTLSARCPRRAAGPPGGRRAGTAGRQPAASRRECIQCGLAAPVYRDQI